MPNFQEIEKNLADMLALATTDLTLLRKKYKEQMSNEDKKTCAGRPTENWPDFKEATKKFQEDKYGLAWKAIQARGGPLKLVRIALPGKLGGELAQELLQQGKSEGNLREELQKKIPHLTDHLLDMVDFDIAELREQFKQKAWNKERFVFAPGLGSNFRRRRIRIKSTLPEKILAQGIVKRGLFKDLLGLDRVYDLQGAVALGYLRNVDICGLRIIKRPEGDRMELTAIELKRSNELGSVMQGIAQATSYRNLAEYCYVAAPGMSAREFYDQERYAEIRNLCEQDDIGIISLNLDSEAQHVDSAEIVLMAKRGQLDNPDLLNHTLEKFGLEFCTLCRRYVERDLEKRTSCGWRTKEEVCMRSLLEEMIVAQSPEAVADGDGK